MSHVQVHLNLLASVWYGIMLSSQMLVSHNLEAHELRISTKIYPHIYELLYHETHTHTHISNKVNFDRVSTEIYIDESLI